MLAKLGSEIKKTKTDTLRVTIERADAFRQEQEAKANKIVEMRDALKTAKSDEARRRDELKTAEAGWESW